MRTPDYPAMFSVFMGMGYQIFVLVWLFIATLMIGFANVFFRPYLFFLTFIYSACTSWVNGFVTAKIMKSFGGTEWCFAAVSAITVFPLYVVGIFVAVDLIEFWKNSRFNLLKKLISKSLISLTSPLSERLLCFLRISNIRLPP